MKRGKEIAIGDAIQVRRDVGTPWDRGRCGGGDPVTMHAAYRIALLEAMTGVDRRSYNLWRRVAARYVELTGGHPLALVLPDGRWV